MPGIEMKWTEPILQNLELKKTNQSLTKMIAEEFADYYKDLYSEEVSENIETVQIYLRNLK